MKPIKIWDLVGILDNMYRVVLLDMGSVDENEGWRSVELSLAANTKVSLYYKGCNGQVYGYFTVYGDKKPNYKLLDEEIKWLKV